MKIRYVPALAAALAGLVSTLAAQQPAPSPKPAPGPAPRTTDPFLKGDKPAAETPHPAAPAPAEPTIQLAKQGLVRLEYFSLPRNLARKMMRQLPRQTELYDWLGKELDNPQSEVKLERLLMVKARSGQRSKVEEINEYPYATEFDPPQIPQSVGIGIPQMVHGDGTNNDNAKPPPPIPGTSPVPPAAPPNPPDGARGATGDPGAESPPAAIAPGSVSPNRHNPPWPYTTVTPSAFAFKNTGWTFETELVVGADGFSLDVNLAPEHIKLVGSARVTSNGEITQPVFETSRLSTQVITVINQPTLAGTVSPPVATGAPGGSESGRTWLLFVTVTPSR